MERSPIWFGDFPAIFHDTAGLTHWDQQHLLFFSHIFVWGSFRSVSPGSASFPSSLSHNIFHTPIFHTQLCHTQLFTYNCLTDRSSTVSFVYPSFPVPLGLFGSAFWKKWTCGVIGSFNFEWSTSDCLCSQKQTLIYEQS